MRISFIQAGGTIEKNYPSKTKGYAFEIAEPAVKRILQRANPNFEFEILGVLKKDSLDMMESNREKILQACRDLDADRIVATHGTDTMIDTARKLSEIQDKTIVLTGALLPERFSNSDVAFNIGGVIGAMDWLPCGVYIAMNGRVYPWNKCKRDMETGWFVENERQSLQ